MYIHIFIFVLEVADLLLSGFVELVCIPSLWKSARGLVMDDRIRREASENESIQTTNAGKSGFRVRRHAASVVELLFYRRN